MEGQDFELHQGGEGCGADAGKPVAVEIKVFEGNEVRKLATRQVDEDVEFEVKDPELAESVEGLVADLPDVGGVQEEGGEVLAADKLVVVKAVSSKVVTVEIQGCGVHGDEIRDVPVSPVSAGDDVRGPGLIVVAIAPLGAPHPAVASVKVAAHAEGEAVGLVAAQELGRFDLVHGNNEVLRRVSQFVAIVQTALQV